MAHGRVLAMPHVKRSAGRRHCGDGLAREGRMRAGASRSLAQLWLLYLALGLRIWGVATSTALGRLSG